MNSGKGAPTDDYSDTSKRMVDQSEYTKKVSIQTNNYIYLISPEFTFQLSFVNIFTAGGGTNNRKWK